MPVGRKRWKGPLTGSKGEMVTRTDVIIIGGGATGCGIARDLALRGIGHYLIEEGDFARGATGACHGLLHSGARYVVSDPEAAKECIEENRILRRIGKKCIEQTGGLFVRLPGDSKKFRDRFLENCERVGIPTQILSPSRALELVPQLNPELEEAIVVPDCSIDPFRLCLLNIVSSRQRGGVALIHHKVVEIVKEKGRCVGVKALDLFTKQVKEIRAKVVVNATGAWGGKTARLAGCDVPLTLSKGSLIITDHRLTNMVVNRLRPASNGDIIVPNEAVCVAGTTSVDVPDPDETRLESWEMELLIQEASRLIPSFASARIIRGYTGVRPLIKEECATDSRKISRSFKIIDHENGLISIIGGKLTTYRYMAEKMTDLIMDKIGAKAPCLTAEYPLEGQDELSGYPLSKRLADLSDIVCECELVKREEVEQTVNRIGVRYISDIQHRTRLGMGPCQGGFCTYRALGIIHNMGRISIEESRYILEDFLQRRFRGIRPALWGAQLREEQMVEGMYLRILGMGEG